MKKMIVFLLLISTVIFSAYTDNLIKLDKADLVWSVEDDELTISIAAETKGWLAVGLGSAKMDGSIMFIGYNKDGEAFFEEHLGKGHSHKKAAVQRPVKFSVDEKDGMTEMLFTVKKSDFVKTGEDVIPVLVAFGARDNFRSIHRYRDSTVLTF